MAKGGQVRTALFAADLLNFHDRTIPVIVVEPIKAEFGSTDARSA